MIENGRLVSQEYLNWQQEEPKTLGYCIGCDEEVTDQHEHIEHPDGLLHDDKDCTYLFTKKATA